MCLDNSVVLVDNSVDYQVMVYEVRVGLADNYFLILFAVMSRHTLESNKIDTI